jgi:hypothetical protein
MDRISESLLTEFSAENSLTSLREETQFEHFAAFVAVSRHYVDAFSTSDVVTGSGGDTGIDAVAILVNGTLVTDKDEVKDLAETNGFVDASFIFVQAERSPSFETSKIGQFGFGVLDFFAPTPKLVRNDNITHAAEIMDAVYAHSSKFKRGKPAARLYYVTTGKWVGDPNLEARRLSIVADLEKQNIFEDVEFIPVDADAIQRLYRQAKNALAREFIFSHRSVVPEMPGVKEAHVGLVPAKEFLSLLDDGAGGILKSLFYDNVRDWQDYNPVNTEIRETLKTAAGRARFVLMNNGVTIIAKNVRPTANKFYIEDYQIVNGCQTSHVLFEQRNVVDETVFVPLRLIATTDEEVVAAIVKATNRQTEVRQEQLIALSDFQKHLESFFDACEPGRRLHYERRSRQYAAGASIEKTRIITPTSLIRAYAAMFLMEPHRTARNYSRLLDRVGTDIFGSDHKYEPYYVAASAVYRLEFLFRNGVVDSKYKPARYQILMAARVLANPAKPGRPNSHDIARYSDAMATVMWDPTKAQDLFEEAVNLVDSVSKGSLDRDTVRTEPFTERLKKAAEERAVSRNSVTKRGVAGVANPEKRSASSKGKPTGAPESQTRPVTHAGDNAAAMKAVGRKSGRSARRKKVSTSKPRTAKVRAG